MIRKILSIILLRIPKKPIEGHLVINNNEYVYKIVNIKRRGFTIYYQYFIQDITNGYMKYLEESFIISDMFNKKELNTKLINQIISFLKNIR